MTGSAPVILAAVLLSGCAEHRTFGPEPDGDGVAAGSAGAPVAIDVDGTWEWRRLEQLRMPSLFVEEVLNAVPGNNLVPEGPNTHARCYLEGTMTLIQTGATFQGIAVRTFASCETNGGQSFQQPGAGLPLACSMARSAAKASPSPSAIPWSRRARTRAVATAIDGTAVSLQGTGRCVLPAHPQSGSIMVSPPPPGGTSKTVSFEASRI